jgi:hypothetical protein
MLVALGLFPLAVMLVLLFAAAWIHEGQRPAATARRRRPVRSAARR